MFFAHFNVTRRGRRRPRGQRAHTLGSRLISGQSGSDDFVAVGESNLAGRNLADLAGEAVIDLVANDQEAEQRPFRLGTEVNRLHESLVEVARAKPPVTRILLIERPLEV